MTQPNDPQSNRTPPASLHPAIWPKEIEETADHLFLSYYDELMGIARALRRRKQLSDTLLTSDLVHEAFLRLRKTDHWTSDAHFLSSVALSMRHVSIDHARSKAYQKRGGGIAPIQFNEEKHGGCRPEDDTLDIHRLLGELAKLNSRQAQIVDCRFFAGFTNEETAKIIGVDERTIRREWTKARNWFALKLADSSEN